MSDVKKGLIKQTESRIENIGAYISDDECIIILSSIIVDEHEENINEIIGQVSYFEVLQTDGSSTNYCDGLEILGYDTLSLKQRYCNLRNKCEKFLNWVVNN